MEGAFNNGMCRCCASEGTFKDVSSKYHWMGEEEIYADMLRECFDITLASASSKGQEGGICEVCITQLRNASNFKKQVLHTEIQFKKKLQDYMYKTNIVKVEVSPLDDADNASDNNLSDDVSDYDVPIKTEAGEPKTKKRGKATPASRAKKPKVEDAETSTKSTRIIKRERQLRSQTKSRLTDKACSNKNDANDTESAKCPVYVQTVYEDDTEVPELLKHRANVRNILLFSNATPIRRYGGVGYICSFCMDQFADPADLKTHTIQRHDKSKTKFLDGVPMRKFIVKLDITSLQCNLCDISIDTLEELAHHFVEDHCVNMYAVDKDYVLPFKFDGIIKRCVICSDVHHTFKGMLEHMSIHYRNYICNVCDRGFVNRCLLMCHAQVHKVGEFECSFCDKVFETIQRQRQHEKRVHTHVNVLRQCDYCNLKFKDSTQRQQHMVKYHDAVFEVKCQACDKTLRNQAAYNIHMKRDHLMERPHKCGECDMEFFRADELKNHMVKHSKTKMFQCSKCLKSYGQRKTLVVHMRIHADDRRFKCEYCDQQFVQKCSLKGHMKTKHGQDLE